MQYVFLGLIQGLTEFLPVSSSGHLVILQLFFDIRIPGVAFETFVHFGTSLAVIFLFKNEIREILSAFFLSLSKFPNCKKIITYIKKDVQCRFAWLLLISTIPGALIGYYFETTFEQLFGNSIFTAFMLIITGTGLFLANKYFIHGNKKILQTSVTDALLIGFAQALAIFPGISRSGFTIMVGLSRRLDREFAAKYSFILSIPIIIGASLYKIMEIAHLNINIITLLISVLTAFISGYWAMRVLIKILMNFKLHFFSYYLWIVGSLVLFLNLRQSW